MTKPKSDPRISHSHLVDVHAVYPVDRPAVPPRQGVALQWAFQQRAIKLQQEQRRRPSRRRRHRSRHTFLILTLLRRHLKGE